MTSEKLFGTQQPFRHHKLLLLDMLISLADDSPINATRDLNLNHYPHSGSSVNYFPVSQRTVLSKETMYLQLELCISFACKRGAMRKNSIIDLHKKR